jgi:RNA polymerase sigma-70 factor, ECF subfamily
LQEENRMDDYTQEFKMLFRESYSRFYFFAFHLVQDEEVSRDIVSECFAAAWHNHIHIDHQKMSGYLFLSIRNKCLNYIKKNKNHYTTSEDVLHSMPADLEGEWKIKEERIVEIERQLDLLPERTRYVLEQCYYEHHTYKEVAEQLGISTNGVKKHIVKAIATLRAHFNIDKQKEGTFSGKNSSLK